jgi:GNAT superfamily N-acetyltransferase
MLDIASVAGTKPPHRIFSPAVALALEVIDDPARLSDLAPDWEALVQATGEGTLLRGLAWTNLWLTLYGPALDARLHVIVGRDDGKVVGIAPFYERSVRIGPGVKAKEIRLLGDAGPRPPALDLLVKPGFEEAFATAVGEHFTAASAPAWDVIDFAPLRDPSRARAYLAERLDATGRKVDSQEASMTIAVTLASAALAPDSLPPPDPHAGVYASDGPSLAKGLTALRRLSRLEWTSRDESSPYADPVGTRMLDALIKQHGASGKLRLARFEDKHGEVTAAALLLDDGARAICVALAVDPEHAADGTKLMTAEARAAAERGLRALDIITGAVELEPPPLPATLRRSLRLRAFNTTAAGALARTYSRFRKRADAAKEAPGAAAAGARAAWTRIRDAAATVAGYERLHLYRGELWTRNIGSPDGLKVGEIGQEAFDAQPEAERHQLIERLELDEGYCREKWRRGDLAVLAVLGGRPAGIAWCARAAVMVPEIAREVRPGTSECYIHDVFVAPDARGKNVAPAMLEDLARRLRQRDVYRAWALIHPANVASTRAFEKAAYASVGDVIHARVGPVDKLVLRPPDPEGKKLLGIS